MKEAFAGLDPTPIGQDTVVEQDARYLEIWQDSMPDRFIFQDDKLLTYPNDYKTPQALLDLEADLQAQMKELDPYGYFTWSRTIPASACWTIPAAMRSLTRRRKTRF